MDKTAHKAARREPPNASALDNRFAQTKRVNLNTIGYKLNKENLMLGEIRPPAQQPIPAHPN